MTAEEFHYIMTEAADTAYNIEWSKANGSYADPYLFIASPKEFEAMRPYLDPEDKYCVGAGWVKVVVYDLMRAFG